MKAIALFLAIALALGAAFALAGELPVPASGVQDTFKLPYPVGRPSGGAILLGAAGTQDTLKLPYPQADTLKNPVEATAASLAKGKSLFSKNCASCHGAKGNGDSPVGKAFTPPAQNLTDPAWQKRFTDGQIFTVIAEGIPGTGMVAFEKSIKGGDRWSLVNYIRTLKVKEVKTGK